MAIKEVELSIIDEESRIMYTIEDVMQNVGEVSATVTIDIIAKKLGTYGFAIQAGMAIGNMIFNTSGLCLGALDTIVYGDMATSMAKILSDAIYIDTDDYYNIGGEQEQRL